MCIEMLNCRSWLLIALVLFCGACSENDGPAQLVNIFGSKGSDAGQFKYVEDFAFDDQGHVLITDALNANVQVFDLSGRYVTEFAGKGDKKQHLKKPEGIAIDASGNIHVADYLTGYIKKYSPSYQHLLTYSAYP